MQSTYKIAMAAAADAGNRNARDAAVETFHSVFGAAP